MRKAVSVPPLGSPFRFLWASSSLSNLADGILRTGAPLLAVTMTRSPLLVSLVMTVLTAPWLLLSLHAGAIADRLDRRRIMIWAGWARTLALAVLVGAAAVNLLSIPLLYAALLVVGAAEVFSDTSSQSVVPMTVPAERLTAANGRLMAAQTVGNHFLGAPLAGLLMAAGAAGALGAPAVLYAAAALLLIGMRGRFQVKTPSTSTLRDDIAVGLRYLWSQSTLRNLAVVTSIINLTTAAYFGVFVLWMVGEQSPVGLTALQYTGLAVVLAVGAIAGSVLAERLTRLMGAVPLLATVTLINGAALVVPVLSATVAAIAPAAAVIGATSAITSVLIVTMRQQLIPEDLFGRVNASFRLLGMGAMPIGATLGGLIGSLAGLPAVFYTTAAAAVVIAVLAIRTLPTGKITDKITDNAAA